MGVGPYRWVVLGQVRRRVDVHVGVFPCYAYHFLRPGEADVAADDGEGGELEGNFVDVLWDIVSCIERKREREGERERTGTGRPTSLGQRGPVCPTWVS